MSRKKRAGEKYFPLVLMLEPLHACNLACIGCGRIVEYKDTIRDQMPLQEALGSAAEADAPIVSICGGEPLMYKHIAALTRGLIEQQKRHVMICTNAILMERFIKQVEPSRYLSFNLHIDGMRETNDRVTDRTGHFDIVVKMIKLLKERGYRVQTNSTIFRETSAEEVDELIRFLGDLGVDGMLLTPGYHYQVLNNDD
ncbi:MAG TPA: adenosyl-hopene transferase HpnH, partial [Candidatus Binataceae bacterium]|nr:adenosyl-hopene transferase HpnH [Candidatus Binataceae bacterium]